MKFRRVVLAVVLLSIGFAAGALAASDIEKVEAFLRRDYQVFVDGEKADVGTVLVYKGSSYLPLARIGALLGADVRWNEANKGIYVNPKFANQPEQGDEANVEYSKITMLQPQGYIAKYRGNETPVLSVMTSDYRTKYYRDVDIRRLGIDTSGLSKSLETLTGELYVTEAEIAKVWTEKPVFTYVYDKLVIGETNPDKLKVLQNFIDGLPVLYELLYKDDPNNYTYYTVPYVFVIDALPGDAYNILGMENNEFKLYWIKLKKNHMDQWYTTEHTIRSIGSNTPYSY